MFESIGTLNYAENWRLTVEIDQQVAAYYRSLIPKYYVANPPKWPAHVTVVRTGVEKPVYTEHWNKYNGRKVRFYYDPTIWSGTLYFWLNIFSTDLEDIREELGLPIDSPFKDLPAGYRKYFHTTIANKKDV